MANITLLRSPGKESVEKKLIKLIHSDLIFYNHKIDGCLYFVVSDMLYGFKQLKLSPFRLSPIIKIFWEDTAGFIIEEGILQKGLSDDFKIIDSYIDLKKLYDLIRLCKK